jgi:tRNA A37 threonylcarbamoyladenosine synthetase subunit TsaC/SUA5/YrdC
MGTALDGVPEQESPMSTLDIKGDARRAMDIIKQGGIAIFPNDVGYAMVGGSRAPLLRIYDTKKRGRHKRNAMACDLETQRELHVLDRRMQEMVEAITVDYDLPLGVIAPFRPDHPLLGKLDPDTLRASTAQGTVAVLMNAGPLHAETCRLSREEVQPLFGSSANITGTGARFRVEDIPDELKAIADIILDYGLRKYHTYRRSGTLISFGTMEVVRIGACYELISDVLKRHFGVELPPDPGTDVLPSGHRDEFALKDVD